MGPHLLFHPGGVSASDRSSVFLPVPGQARGIGDPSSKAEGYPRPLSPHPIFRADLLHGVCILHRLRH